MGRPRKIRDLPQPHGRVLAYGRVSSPRASGRQLISLAAQQAKAIAYFKYKLEPEGHTWLEWWADDQSARKLQLKDRKAGSHLLSILQRGDHLIVSSFDRAFRSAGDGLMFVKWCQQVGVTLHILNMNIDTSTYIGRAFVGMMAVFAEMDNEQRAERVQAALDQLRAEGKPVGSKAPYGYTIRYHRLPGKQKPIRRLEINEHEFAIMLQIHRMIENGETLGQIADKLDAHGLRNRDGDPHTKGGVWKLNETFVRYLALNRVPEKFRPESLSTGQSGDSQSAPTTCSTKSGATPSQPTTPTE